RPGQLSRVSGAIAEAGGNISSVGAWEVEEGVWGAVMKVETLSADRATAAVSGLAGVTVVDVRG
ncbi:MAG: ACT domain-containing protein, partial [Proteobacteria bacterium]|nr:ACT domain-containing protein [Pseudomonadota bacterium]